MGKPKKNQDQEDFENGDDMETQNTTQTSSKTEKKKKKKGKQKDDDWDDIESEMQAMTLEANKGNDDEEESIPVPKKSKVKTKGVSAFALLANLGEDSGGDDDSDDKKSDDESEKKEETVNVQQKSKKKEKSKKEKPKKQEDEDIDAILAEIEKPATKSEKKKKKKDKGDAEEDNNEDGDETPIQEVEKVESKVVSIDDLDDEFEDDKKKRKKNKKNGKEEESVQEEKKEEDDAEANDGDGEEFTIKTAAQKKKEKKEREKQKKIEEKQKQLKKDQAKKEKEAQEGSADVDKSKDEATNKSKEPKKKEEPANKEKDPEPSASHEATPEGDEGEVEDKKDKKKKKKKGEKDEKKEEKKEEKGKPKNKKIAALKEALRIKKEEEEQAIQEAERLRLEEEERIQQLEEEIKRKEELKKQKKLAKKEREAQLKKEGKFLTEKQKQDKRKLEQMLAAMKLSGVEIGPRPTTETTSKRGMVYGKKKKPTGNKEKSPSTVTSPTAECPSADIGETKEEKKEAEVATDKREPKVVKDEWDAESEEEKEEEEESSGDVQYDVKANAGKGKVAEPDEEEEEDDEDEEEESDSEESEEEESESEDEDKSPIDKGREKIQKRAEKADKARTLDNLRAPVVCVLGHVDTGKTKILDKLRRTNVQDGEAGGITQQIGATNVPKEAVVDKTKMVKEFAKQELKIPGLLIIDTPGHESFSNLRLRGSSLCDIAILVVDIMHGLEPQTIESINLLKERKTPFLVALNKIDRLYQWKPQPMNDVQNTLKKQNPHTKAEFDERTQQVILQLAEEGLNASLFYENKNPREYVSLVPTSAHSGDGMGNLVALVCDLCQNMLAKRLMYSTELQATVMEVKAITGMGTTIDVILINGSINEGDSVVLAGTEGPIVTQIRGLLMPQPMKELRVKSQYEHHKTVLAAQGVKINAKDMEKALAGLPLFVAHDNDEREYYKDEVAIILADTLDSIKVQDRGVFVQASTLGSLEALLEFLRTSKIPYAGINIGPVHKKDIMKASVMVEHDSQYAVILAFDVKVEREAQELADSLGVRIFTAEIIYHLFDAFTKYRADLKKQKQEEFKHIAVFPCKLRVLPQYIFNSRDPIVMGVSIEAGFLKEGTPICVPSKDFVDIGRVGSLELNHKQVDMARQGQEVCIKIIPLPGEAPKMYGRHFEDTDMLVSKITRQSIDAVKDYFRDDMTKPDWKLMVELKKQFQIL